MSGVTIVMCPACGTECGREHADLIQQVDIAQARAMLREVEDKERILNLWKYVGFITVEF
ncbi:MAG: hypothetical protein CVV44_20265 [Spirochaetae bacterium HGW-Spirochaetae-1]|nr:MAG: hypothetical protein CVV44_20265 [Spirochaetae bacterium HGW-Spirochaetae-1]